jgi:fission process protein 1
MTKEPSKKLSSDDVSLLIQEYDVNHDGKLSEEEIQSILNDSHAKQDVKNILLKFDENGDGILDENEKLKAQHDILMDSSLRIAGYTGVYARLFRYLAFTSDFGEALRPVIKLSLVNLSYAISIGYCFADVGLEAYNLHERGYVTRDGKPMSMTQCVVERSVFQGLASVLLPFGIIHTTVSVGKKIFGKIGRFTKFGPSILGLSIIPLLPLYLDHPCEQAIEYGFERYGPWRREKEHES